MAECAECEQAVRVFAAHMREQHRRHRQQQHGEGMCRWCGAMLIDRKWGVGRQREYCNQSHRQLAYIDRKKTATDQPPEPTVPD